MQSPEHPPPPPPYSPPGQEPTYPPPAQDPTYPPPAQKSTYPLPEQDSTYPHPGVHQPGVGPSHTVVTGTPVIVTQPTTTMVVSHGVFVGPDPTFLTCPSCRNQIVTRVNMTPSCRTHVIALILCLFVWPCACLPYCIGSCNDADHYCPYCSTFIGSYRF